MKRSIGLLNQPIWLGLKPGEELTVIVTVDGRRESFDRYGCCVIREYTHYLVVQRENYRDTILKKDIMTGATTLRKRDQSIEIGETREAGEGGTP